MTMQCPEPDCREYRFVPYSNARERHEITQRTYPCSRHKNPEQVVGPGNSLVQTVFVATDSKVQRNWTKEGSDRPGMSGSVSCIDAFLAYAGDVPAGSRLIVTAHVEVADEAPTSGGETA